MCDWKHSGHLNITTLNVTSHGSQFTLCEVVAFSFGLILVKLPLRPSLDDADRGLQDSIAALLSRIMPKLEAAWLCGKLFDLSGNQVELFGRCWS